MTRKLFALALFALLLPAGAALADEATPAAETPEPAAPAAEQCQPADLAEGTLDPRGSAQELSTFCQATCADGSKISVTCNGTCGATDQVCSDGTQVVQGKVTCNGSTVRTCPDCPVGGCDVETNCPDGTILYCEGSDEWSCDGGDPFCYVQCDGVWEWCPGHFGQELCEI